MLSRRHELFSGYKGQRPPMPSELAQAIPRVRDVLKACPSEARTLCPDPVLVP